MKKIIIISLLIFLCIPCSGMNLSERQVKYKSQRIDKALKLGTATTSAGVFYAGCSSVSRILGEFAQERPWHFTINSVIPLRIAKPYWSSMFASFAQKIHLPESLVGTLKPYMAHKGCRYPIAIGAGIFAACSLYKIASITNFFGLKVLLYKITGLKQEKRQLKVDKNRALEDLEQDVAQKNNQISRQCIQIGNLKNHLRPLQLQNVRLEDKIAGNRLRVTHQANEIIRLTAELQTSNIERETAQFQRRASEAQLKVASIQIKNLESKINLIGSRSRLQSLNARTMFEMVTTIIENPSRKPNMALYQESTQDLVSDWLELRRNTDQIPIVFKQALGVISKLAPETRRKTLAETCKKLIDVARESRDTSLALLLKNLTEEAT